MADFITIIYVNRKSCGDGRYLCHRLEDILHQESKLYLVFEFVQYDLKRYIDSLPAGSSMDPMLVKVGVVAVCGVCVCVCVCARARVCVWHV